MFKKAFTLCLASLMAFSLFAADIAGRITLSVAGNSNFTLLIDGKHYPAGSNRMYVAGLRPGSHTIQVYAVQRANKRNHRPVHSATFTVRPQYDMHIAIDRSGYVHFNETRLRSNNNRDGNDQTGRKEDWNEKNDRYGNDRDNRYRNSDDWKNENNRWEKGRALSDYDYSLLVQQVRKQRPASSKYNTAKEAVTHNLFRTQKLSGLLQLLSSESHRLEVAKVAYRNTVDAENYRQLFHLFSRQAQIELSRFINSNR